MATPSSIKINLDTKVGSIHLEGKGTSANIIAEATAKVIIFAGVGVASVGAGLIMVYGPALINRAITSSGLRKFIEERTIDTEHPEEPPIDTGHSKEPPIDIDLPEEVVINVVAIKTISHEDGKERFQIESFDGVLQAFDSRFASLIPNSAVRCSSLTIGTQERFRFIDVGSGEFAMKASNGKFVFADPNNGGLLEARGDCVQDWERFHLVKHKEGVLSIRSRSTGKLVCADQNRDQMLVADRDLLTNWGNFTIGML